MRIHRLEIQAFGPFAGREVVDFDALGAQGLFLLNGATGAGKTSVLDSIAYALYGAVPGARQGAVNRLRSHHAAAGVEPEVILEFSVGTRRLEVRRSPEWMRPLKRGTGTTREPAKTQLREKTAERWTVKSTRNDEAAAEIHALLGMNMAQFTKVVLLAQGEFAAFLQASADERSALLQKLFGTDVYRDLEIRLATDSREATAAVSAGLAELAAAENLARSQAGAALGHMDDLAQDAEPEQGGQPAQDADTASPSAEAASPSAEAASPSAGSDDVAEVSGVELFARLEALLQAAVVRAEERAKYALASSEGAAATAKEAELSQERHRARDAALTEKLRLDKLKKSTLGWQLQLDRHHEAQVLTPVLTAASKAASEYTAATATMSNATQAFCANDALKNLMSSVNSPKFSDTAPALAEVPGIEAEELTGVVGATSGSPARTSTSALDVLAPSAAQLEEVDRKITTGLAEVAAAVPDEQRYTSKSQEMGRVVKALERAKEDVGSEKTAEASARAQLMDVAAQTEGIRSVAGNIDHAKEGENAAILLVHSIQGFCAQKIVVAEAEKSVLTAREGSVAAREKWLDAFNRRLTLAAGELARKLVDGEPCKVCGSLEHPAPSALAGASNDLIEEEESAKTASERAEVLAQAAKSIHAEAKSELAVLAARGGDGVLEEAQVGVVLAKQAHQRAQEATTRLVALSVQIRTFTAEVERAQAAVLSASGRVASLTATQAALEAEIAQIAAELRVARGGYDQLGERQAALSEAQMLTTTLLANVRRESVAAKGLADAASARALALQSSSFSDALEVNAALLASAAAEQVVRQLAEYAQAAAVNADRCGSAEVMAASREAAQGKGAPTTQEVDRVNKEAQRTKMISQHCILELGMTEQAAAQVAHTRGVFRSVEENVAPLRDRAQLLLGLADAVRGSGENRFKMTLTSYVLAARLEQVAAAASLRLGTMSDGRYTLSHTDARTGGNRKSGLGLEVVDQWTGQRRDTSTLSGGESFMASLSLALGLADVVQHESGGLDIETLFVDEGFGSLDEQSLEQVMDALEGLRDGGRVVGLVSHVAEMKQRIPLHLNVHKGRNGSTLAVGQV
ncbi:AAA family ATPase [Arthrobacter cryoconiti]|uniref:Nuclease SbcCD subunit C n=1 Tax=Arthrobacter cryoconiti TaxID=748907 RepID=A0ABV8QW00_9MICC|nr:SMC family ATPase [Arthrobacter cryoconiti]MCC9068891.1 SMC family ATPase [Arthrobacter cryoconiti]